MKLIVERGPLQKALAHAQSVVERRNTIPILNNIMLRAKDDRLSLVATDMDLEIVESIPAIVEVDGETTAPAHMLYDIARKLPDGAQIGLDADGRLLSISAGRSKFKLGTLPVDDFPRMAEGDLARNFELTPAELKQLIDRTRFAISTEETRYYLNGIYVHATTVDNAPVLRGVATDGHRLAKVEMPMPEGADGMPGVIVPRKTVAEVRKLLDDASEAVKVGLSETKIRFEIGSVVMTSKLIDGTFPDYERVIPPGNDKHLSVNPKAFAAAVDRVATVASEKTRAVKFQLARGQMTLSVISPEAGSAVEELEVQYDNTPLEIGFNSRYLMDIASQIEGEACLFSLNDSQAPTIIRDSGDSSALYVLMPMRV